MQHVKLSWLRKLNYGLIGVTIILFAVYILFEQLGVSDATKARWGITPLILTLGIAHALFVIFAHAFIFKRLPWLTMIISIALFSFMNASIIESSGNTNIFYRASFAIIIFLSAMTGTFAPVAAIVFTWILLIFTITGIATPTNASLTFNIIADLTITLAGYLGWRFFSHYYLPSDDKETQKLVGTLKAEQIKSNLILESITDGVLIVSPEGTVQVMNESSAKMLGWDRQEATRLDYRSLFSVEVENEAKKDEQIKDAITLSLDSKKAAQKVSLIKTHHEKNTYIDIVASPIHQTVTTNTDGNTEQKEEMVGVVAVLRDVDAQTRQEQQRSDFISTASHEMRTPVAAIQGFLELALNKKVSTVDDKARGYLEKAYESTKHLGGLFQDLLTASRSEDGRLVNNPEIIDVNEFLQTAVEQGRVNAKAKELDIQLADSESANGNAIKPLLYVNADPERLHEVIMNLIENAIKYTKKGVITIGASVKDQSVVIRISDTGIGIATEDIPHLFQKFYRTDNSETREVGGTGLGLYITKQIVEMMGGRVWVESTLGAGSTFFVQIPRVAPGQVEQMRAAQQPTQP